MSALTDNALAKHFATKNHEILKTEDPTLEVPVKTGFWKKIAKIFARIFCFVGECFTEDPATHNERVAKRNDRHPPVRGIY